ncbi:trypsin 3A1-like [Ochlerotatus camptorhynchus]|uniref:trypsin 3A1-like n=1 Tax=Ochlerotatus camptorhynchus TaxID=644619 RepID=UPI0031E4028A
MEFRTYLMVLFIGAFDGRCVRAGVDGLGGSRIVPYRAAIEYKGTVFCAGSVVETTWILTAAECVMNKTVSYVTVRLGSSSLYEGGILFGVKSSHVHPKYNAELSKRDMGLLKLSTTLKFSSTIAPVPLVKPGYGMEEGTKCTILNPLSNSMDTKAKLWSRERCETAYPNSFYFTDDALCAKITAINTHNQNDTRRNHTCNDHQQQQQQQRFMLGSPLVCEGKQVAVVSRIAYWGAGQCGAVDAAGGSKSGLPDVFSDVAFADHWISSHLIRRKRKPVGGGRRRSSAKLRQSQRRNDAAREMVPAIVARLLLLFHCFVML